MNVDPSDVAVSTYATEAARDIGQLSASVTICDATLRDGEQTAGVSFSLEDRITIARELDRAGVGQIQLSYPGISDEDARTTRQLVDLHLAATTEVIAMLHVDNWKHQIDAAIASGADVISVIHGVGSVRLRDVYGITAGEAVRRICTGIEYAKARGAQVVNFSATDAPRADESLLRELYPASVASGADRVRINDSAGACSPAGMRHLVSMVRSLVDVPVGVHCHDDFGLATANSVASVEAGASIVDVCVNGLGERAGNAALEEVAATLEMLYGVHTGVDLQRLTVLSNLVSAASGRYPAVNKSIVGADVFAHTFDTHIRDYEIAGWTLHEPFNAEAVGNRRQFPLHRMSGVHTVRMWLREAGFEVDPTEAAALVPVVREAAAASDEPLTHEQFRALVLGVRGATA